MMFGILVIRQRLKEFCQDWEAGCNTSTAQVALMAADRSGQGRVNADLQNNVATPPQGTVGNKLQPLDDGE